MPSTVDALASEMVTVAAAALTDEPDRQFVSHGEPAWDCSQVSAHLVRLRPKLTGRGDQCTLVWIAAFQVVLLRCDETLNDDGSPPSAAALNAQNVAWAAEGEALARGFSSRWAAGTWPAGMSCSTVSFQPLEPFKPQGGLAGWRLTIEIELT